MRASTPAEHEPTSVVDHLRAWAQSKPEAVAFRFLGDGCTETDALTFAALDRRARILAARISDFAAQGDRVVLAFPPSLDFIVAFFACLYARVIAVPSYPPGPARTARNFARLEAIARDATPALILGSRPSAPYATLEAECPALTRARYLNAAGVLEDPGSHWSAPKLAAADIAFVQYTSGSTSAPRGVVISHSNLISNYHLQRELFHVSHQTVMFGWLPFFHDMGLIGTVLLPVFLGVSSTLMPAVAFIQQPARWLRGISRYRATISPGPNFAYELCTRTIDPAQEAGVDLSSWTTAVNGAEPTRRQTMLRFAQKFAPLGFRASAFHPSYGLAEATLVVTGNSAFDPAQGDDGPVSCGKLTDVQRVRIVDPASCAAVRDGEVGEVWVQGPCVGARYWNQPEQTAATFGARRSDAAEEGAFMRTGDLGFVARDELYITGRLKDLIIIRGRNHYPHDLELTAETAHPALAPGDGAAFAVEHEDGEQLVLVYRRERGNSAPIVEVATAVARAIAELHEIKLAALLLVDRKYIPKTSSGKIQRQVCKAAYLQGQLPSRDAWIASVDSPAPCAARRAGPATSATPSATRSLDEIADFIADCVCRRLGPAASVELDRALAEYGLDSAELVRITGELESWLGAAVPPALFFRYPTIVEAARSLSRAPAAVERELDPLPQPAASADREPIAIVGIGCRAPGASGPEQLWSLLCAGVDVIRTVPAERWSLERYFDEDPSAPGKTTCRWGGFLDGVDQFDAEYFGISAREASQIDPQQRLLLEVTSEALLDAGLAGRATGVGRDGGVFIGISTYDYGQQIVADLNKLSAYSALGGALSIAANRLSYFLDWHGPSLAIDSACSSSLVAVTLAVQSLRRGESEVAIAGGVNVILSPAVAINLSKAGVLAGDGRCKSFDASADGYVRGEGAGVVVLKPLSKARADGDRIYALILGCASNSDGRSNGLLAPNPAAQERVLRAAYRDAGVSPVDVDYVEAHGSGTRVGDTIEAGALGAVIGAGRSAAELCRIGSIKTNLGHLEAAAGVFGLIKAALSLHHAKLPKSLHFERPATDLAGLGLAVQRATEAWPERDRPRLAGVSSFGFGGSNAHVVLRSAEATEPATEPAPIASTASNLLVLSAQSTAALRAYAGEVLQSIEAGAALDALCHTAACRTDHLKERASIAFATPAELSEGLERLRDGRPQRAVYSARAASVQPSVGFVFSGQGTHWIGMGRRLFEVEPVFRSALERLDRLCQSYAGFSLLRELEADADSRTHLTEIAQPVLFSIQVALAALWASWGVRPDFVVGHSAGEVAASCVAGALSFEDAMRVIVERGRIARAAVGNGAMAAVAASAERIAALDLIGPGLHVAAFNGPESIVLAGDPARIAAAVAQLSAAGVFCRVLPIGFAAHGPAMTTLGAELAARLSTITPRPPTIPIVSTVSASIATEGDFGAAYWARNLREPVRFEDAVALLAARGCTTFVEIAPHPALAEAIGRTCGAKGKAAVTLSSMRRGADEHTEMLAALGGLHALGYPVSWPERLRQGRFQRLPNPVWRRERHWLDADESGEQLGDGELADCANEPGLCCERPAEVEDWCYAIEWRASETCPVTARHDTSWVILDDGLGFAERLADVVIEKGGRAALLGSAVAGPFVAGERFDSCSSDELGRMLQLAAADCAGRELRVVHCLALALGAPSVDEVVAPSPERALLSLCALSRAIHESPVQRSIRLCVLTRGAVATSPVEQLASPPQAALWGLLNVLRSELPELAPVVVDVDPKGGPDDAAGVYELIVTAERSASIALRGARAYYPQLARYRPRATAEHRPPLHAEIVEPGSLDRVALNPIQSDREFGCTPRQVRIEVRAAGVTFSDVLAAYGILSTPKPASGLGWECAGVVREVGAEVTRFRPGDAVLALAPCALAESATAREEWVVHKPAALSFEQTAAVPVAFVIAHYGLTHLARLQSGEAVLIHCGSGGVGLAAVEVACEIGARVIATASTGERAAYLRSRGVHVVVDARQSNWPELVREASAGKGVDVVLNSLPGDAVQKGFAALAGGGRWIEIGQSHAYQQLAVDLGLLARGGALFRIVLSTLMSERAALVQQLLSEVASKLASGAWKVAPITAFPLAEAPQALQYLAERRHIGKVVLQCGLANPPRPCFSSEETYLITGGLGALGRLVASWLVARGARHLALLQRSEPTPEALEFVRSLEAQQARVTLVYADVADSAAMRTALDRLRARCPPLRGVVHAAGVLRDAPLFRISAEQLNAVLAPKLSGAWNLHHLTRQDDLEAFVLFTSAANILGSVAQGAYAAANAALDALAQQRFARGLPGVAISWGPWDDLGMARVPGLRERCERNGIGLIEAARAPALFDYAFTARAPQLTVAPIDWSRAARSFADPRRSALFNELVASAVRTTPRATSESAAAGAHTPRRRRSESVEPRRELRVMPASASRRPPSAGHVTRDDLLRAEDGRRGELLREYVQQLIAGALRVPAHRVERAQPLNELGLDSIMSMEIRATLEKELQLQVPLSTLLNAPTIDQLSQELLAQLGTAPVHGEAE